ncbi:MAG: hypothetical protein ABIF88_02030 [archaeon]
MESLCIKCKGKGLCGYPCRILNNFIDVAPKPRLHFTGSSAPEVFVGQYGYPNINSGILAPSDNDKIAEFATAEEWSKNNFSIENVLRIRAQLIYGKSQSHIKSTNKLKQVTQELALSSKPVSTEVFLHKKPILKFTTSSVFSPMTNPAPIKSAILQENPKVEKKVDYLTSDYDVKSVIALKELYNSKIPVDHLQKLLSVGLLGIKSSRRMVPTRWSITATDDTISKQLLEKIRYYKEIETFQLFEGNFVGNYIQILLLPGTFSFEAIEVWLAGSAYTNKTAIATDYEFFHGRKTYASNITGGYYAMRFPVTEYLEKIKRQATVFIIRKITQEYYAPLGVGIVRETTRRALRNQPIFHEDKNQALNQISEVLKIPKEKILEHSKILNEYGKQKSLRDFW